MNAHFYKKCLFLIYSLNVLVEVGNSCGEAEHERQWAGCNTGSRVGVWNSLLLIVGGLGGSIRGCGLGGGFGLGGGSLCFLVIGGLGGGRGSSLGGGSAQGGGGGGRAKTSALGIDGELWGVVWFT